MSVIGLDTSNYTTSIAFFDGVGGLNCSKLLPVKAGEFISISYEGEKQKRRGDGILVG